MTNEARETKMTNVNHSEPNEINDAQKAELELDNLENGGEPRTCAENGYHGFWDRLYAQTISESVFVFADGSVLRMGFGQGREFYDSLDMFEKETGKSVHPNLREYRP